MLREAAATTETRSAAEETPDWYKDAIIYQVHVRSFHDSNDDGIGDFRGLTSKLDYIQDLGVTAIWLLPFYPSPLKDDGYDIADYTTVNPIYGTLRDFKAFLREAHRRDLKVITELVLNHTSDEHPWFQRARRSKAGSKWREFYVWGDDPHRYKEARIIFKDFESSNWAWDPVAEAYYWHRFYSHQPDLNFDNPDVHQALVEVLDFWLGMGVDGLRLDAVPYLYEREGTTCENLPETHGFLKQLRAHIDEKFENKMLLAEANQWPEDAVAYFGDGDECHMNFHFPLMPRLFMAIQREDRFPVIDILQQTPELPPHSQWAIFLRNHDELTLEMVTDEERDYMYRTYAEDPEARINLGIRRRLGPLLKNNRRKIELMNGLLLSLPGTPVVYYGDEIRMGDNIYLGDRDAVRTPMQWSPDRNGGFSRTNPQKLFLPIIIDPEYHYETRNVETEQNSPHSLLWWMKRIVSLRKQFSVFGRGSLEFLYPDNPKVLAYIRQHEDEAVLMVANLSRFAQYVELDLSRFRGMLPTELFGQTKFPMVGELPYLLTLGPHSFYWFKLEWPAGEQVRLSQEELPSVRVRGEWESVFRGRTKARLEAALPQFLEKHRWFAGKARTIRTVSIEESIFVTGPPQGAPMRLVGVRIAYAEGEPELYALPIAFATGEQAANIMADHPTAGIVRLNIGDGQMSGILCDATRERELWVPLLEAIARRRNLKGWRGELTPLQTKVFRKIRGGGDVPLEPTVQAVEQSNSSASFGDRFMLKLFRRLHPETNPDLEISRFLTERTSFAHIPRLAGALEYEREGEKPMTVAILNEYIANEGDAWKYTLHELGRFFERLIAQPEDGKLEQKLVPRGGLLDLIEQETPDLAQEMIGAYLQSAELLGRRTAELHMALASHDDDRAFAPEPFTAFYQRGLYQSMRTQARQSFSLLRKQLKRLPDVAQEEATRVLDLESDVLERFRAVADCKTTALRIRTHGDYHLGQVLYTGKDFVIIDFEGEPDRPVSERRIKRSPLRDVAGMIRSFHYASNAALMGQVPGLLIHSEGVESFDRWMHVWYVWTAAAFLRSYFRSASEAAFLPKTGDELRMLMNAYTLEKLVYELSYELNNRPDWVRIPLQGILQLSETEA